MGLGLVDSSNSWRGCTRPAGRSLVELRPAVRSVVRRDVFAVLVLALIAGSDLLRRVLVILQVQPKLVGRHFSAFLV